MATHSSVLAWRIPGMGEPGGLPSKGSHRVGHDWSDLVAAAVAAANSVGYFFPLRKKSHRSRSINFSKKRSSLSCYTGSRSLSSIFVKKKKKKEKLLSCLVVYPRGTQLLTWLQVESPTDQPRGLDIYFNLHFRISQPYSWHSASMSTLLLNSLTNM